MRANGISARHHTKDLVKEVAALKAQLRKLSSAIESEANAGVSRTLGTIESKSKEAIDSAIETAQEFIDQYADSARETASAMVDKGHEMHDELAESLAETVRNRPLGTPAAVIGIGFVAGYLCRRT